MTQAWFSRAQADAAMGRPDGVPYAVCRTADGLHAVLATAVGDHPGDWADAVPLGPVDGLLGTPARPGAATRQTYPGRRLTREALEAVIVASVPPRSPLAVPLADASRLVRWELSMPEVITAAVLALRLVTSVREGSRAGTGMTLH